MLREYRSILPNIKKYAWRYVFGFLFLVTVDAIQLIIPQIIKRAVDLIASGVFELADIARLCGLIALVALAISCGRFVWRRLIFGSARRIETELRQSLFAKLLSLGTDFYQKNKTGDLMARATNDVSQVRQATGMGLVAFVDGVFMSISILIVMFAQNAKVALFTVIPLPIITLLIIGFGGFVSKRFERVQASFSRLSDLVQEGLSGVRVVKAFVREDHFANEFSKANDDYREANMVLVKVWGFFFPLVNFLAGITLLILLAAGGRSVMDNRFSAGDIVSMVAYLEMLIWPMLGAGFTVNIIQRGAASLKRINEVLDSQSDIAQASQPLPGLPSGDIELRSLWFRYPGADDDALSDLNLRIASGKTLGILGRTGSGKSSLLKLLPRLMDCDSGMILFGGHNLGDYELGRLRSAFGFVPQDSFLFSMSIRQNIGFGCDDLGDEELSRIIKICALDRDLNDFPQGWDTLVGERGLSLSGGQKQLVAIARALALRPQVLILDDALSAVDTQTEEKILRALLAERRGRTNIIVSHRVSTLKVADRIIVLEGGCLVQEGDHASLVASGQGFYAEIARLQQLDREAGDV